MFARAVVATNCRMFLCCPLRSFCWWVGHAVRANVCHQPTAGSAVELVCVVFLSSPWDRSHFGVVLTSTGAACTLPCWWCCFGCCGQVAGLACRKTCRDMVIARFALGHCGRGPGATLDNSCHGQVGGGGPQENLSFLFSCCSISPQFFRGNCSMYRCRFSVFVNGGELRVFLCHHLGPPLKGFNFKYKAHGGLVKEVTLMQRLGGEGISQGELGEACFQRNN